MTPSRDIDRLLEIMRALRDPKTGCAWDIEQTFDSIAPFTIEEAYEVADAIQRQDMPDLCQELGDLLLQVVYHAQMAQEAGAFDFGDVVAAVSRKMVRRHPHVFGSPQERARGMRPGDWERIKAEEKAERAAAHPAANKPHSLLDEVPGSLPPLKRAVKLQKEAGRVGFDWQDPKAVIAKISEEVREIEAELEPEAPDPARLTDELGDILFAAANLARHLNIDPDYALESTNQKFKQRFAVIEKTLRARGQSLEEASLAEMEAIWQAAKKDDKPAPPKAPSQTTKEALTD